jgi:CTP:molybdopterin cytidylyltransferase MocA
VTVFTGMGKHRKVIDVLSADVVVVCGGGGPCKAFEAVHALKAGRPLILVAVPPLWRDLFCSLSVAVETAAAADAICVKLQSNHG